MTGLPLIEDIEYTTDVVDVTPEYENCTFYKDYDLVQKDGEIQQINFIKQPLLFDETLVEVVIGDIVFFPEMCQYRKILTGLSLLPNDSNTQVCPIEDYTFRDPAIAYQLVTRGFEVGVWYEIVSYITYVYEGIRGTAWRKWEIEDDGFRAYTKAIDVNGDIYGSSDTHSNIFTSLGDIQEIEYTDVILLDGSILYGAEAVPTMSTLKNDMNMSELYTPSFLRYSALNQDKPFDDIGTTLMVNPDSATYTLTPNDRDSYVCVIVSNVVATHVDITIDGVTTTHTADTKLKRESIFHYVDDVTAPLSSPVLVTVYNLGSTVQIGTVGLAREVVNLGITSFKMGLAKSDYTEIEVGRGGAVSLSPDGVILSTIDFEVFGELRDLPGIFAAIGDFGKKRMAFDGTDSYKGNHFLSKMLRYIGRITSSSLSTDDFEGLPRENDPFVGSYTIEEAS